MIKSGREQTYTHKKPKQTKHRNMKPWNNQNNTFKEQMNCLIYIFGMYSTKPFSHFVLYLFLIIFFMNQCNTFQCVFSFYDENPHLNLLNKIEPRFAHQHQSLVHLNLDFRSLRFEYLTWSKLKVAVFCRCSFLQCINIYRKNLKLILF